MRSCLGVTARTFPIMIPITKVDSFFYLKIGFTYRMINELIFQVLQALIKTKLMRIVRVKSTPRPEAKDKFIKAFQAIMPVVHAEEGCLEYRIYQDCGDANTLLIFERWESQAALDAHLQTPHMQAFFKEIEPYFDAPTPIVVYAAEEV